LGLSNGGWFVDRVRVERFRGLDAFYGRRVELNIDLRFASSRGDGFGHGRLKSNRGRTFLRNLQVDFGGRVLGH
jgi:hypothetical protein